MTIFIGIDANDNLVGIDFSAGAVYGIFAAVLAVMLAFHVMWAGRAHFHRQAQGIKTAWLAWIPFVNRYVMGKISGQANLFGLKVKNMGVWVMLLEFLDFALMGTAVGLYYADTLGAFFAGEHVYLMSAGGFGSLPVPVTATGGELLIPYASAASVLSMISSFVALIALFFSISLYLDFFKRLVPETFWVYTLLSVLLDVTGLMVFLVRKKDPVDYKEYMQNKYRPHVLRRGQPLRADAAGRSLPRIRAEGGLRSGRSVFRPEADRGRRGESGRKLAEQRRKLQNLLFFFAFFLPKW